MGRAVGKSQGKRMHGFEFSDELRVLKDKPPQDSLGPPGRTDLSGQGGSSSGAGQDSAGESNLSAAGRGALAGPARLLVIDDEEAIRFFLHRRLTEAGYQCDDAKDGLQGLQMLGRDGYDLVICDIRLPDVDGLEILKHIKGPDNDVAVIMLTAVTDLSVAIRALKAGACDYLVKPFNVEELMLSVGRALEKRTLAIQKRRYQEDLEAKVSERTRELVQKNRDLSNLLLNTIQSLIFTPEAKDTYTEGHSWKVALLAKNLARRLGLGSAEIENISLSGLLHDIGKIGVRDAILNKASKLTSEEYAHIQQHPVIGEKILAPLEPLRLLLPCVRHHHEWYNGAGYPDGLAGDKIPLSARILTIADAYDAITSERAYRPARSRDEAITIIEGAAAAQFDPAHVKAFIEMIRD